MFEKVKGWLVLSLFLLRYRYYRYSTGNELRPHGFKKGVYR